MTENKIRVGLVDDMDLMRSGLTMVIDSLDDMQVVLSASDGQQALNRLQSVPVDVILMDVRMEGMDGLTATRQITSTKLPTGVDPKIIILTTFDEDDYMMEGIRAGASGFLLKDAPTERMIEAIRTIYRGDAVIAPSTTRRLVDRLASETYRIHASCPAILDVLTDREREVFHLIARGLTNTEIAERLFVAEATVKTHVTRIFAKLGVRDRVQAVVVAYEAGIVTPGQGDL
ncbi:response regulator [Arcanobacterium phocae]|uniref:DNA-binding response regulator, NarL/FixJ family, contains REC and HTH domains n=1 Tax=Arcanobacterium phocae TaxID=131112 RepID=A0A1H2L9R0_9ACTO|nr:response regulator transcription factor [Arcanobacterium phocae]SDU77455.1 DNA-binding response regulator, NarL/FixJ family, contains REC and HTH domains [Arcanobacterium phocae]